MGWKSTVTISRDEAISLINARLRNYEDRSNEELGDLLEEFGYGDNSDLPYYGANFHVTDEIDYENLGI